MKTKALIVPAIVLLLFMQGVPASAQQPPEQGKSESIVRIDGDSYYVHTVVAGETLYSLARAYGVTTGAIVHYNPLIAGGLKAGQVLKIPAIGVSKPKMSQRKQNRLFDEHVVKPGETAYSISKTYSVPVKTLLEDNPSLDPAHISIGQVILVRKSEMGDSDEIQAMNDLEEYKNALNSVSTDYAYHLVEQGETLYSLSKQYGIPQEELVALNGLTDGLKAGAMIRLPIEITQTDYEEPDLEQVQQPEEETFEEIELTRPESYGGADIALLLPLKTSGPINPSFLDFYQGFLLGMEDLKAEGLSFTVNVFDTKRSADELARIVETPAFRQADLIVGPVYADEIENLLPYAKHNRIAVVSPLSNVDDLRSPVLFGMAPTDTSRIEKLRPLFVGDKNIVLIYGTKNDSELEHDVKTILGSTPYRTYKYNGPNNADMSSLFKGESENLYVVLSQDESEVDKILASLSSAHNNLVSRSQLKGATIRVLGSPRWGRFSNIDRNLFFKMQVCFVSSYMAKRGDGTIDRFDSRYITAFRTIPSMFSYRGYDAAMIFGRALYAREGITEYVEGNAHKPLQTVYRFGRDRRGAVLNNEWMLICYNGNYTITGE